MNIASSYLRQKRSGMTLIELLVVMFIIVTVAGLAVLLMPRLQSEKGSRGAQDLQSALMIAKQRALRDRAPCGVRLIRDPNDASGLTCRSFMYIQQPDNFSGGSIRYQSATPNIYFVSGTDVTGGLNPSQPETWPIQAGDYLYVNGILRGLITTVTATTQGLTVLGDAPSADIVPTSTWYVVRRPRPIPGEEVVYLPEGVAVDFNYYSATIPRSILPLDGNNYDILFNPGASVAGAAGKDGQVVLWVRDTTRQAPDLGEQILIVVYTRTGQIGQYPVDTSNGGADPHSYRTDAKFRPAGL